MPKRPPADLDLVNRLYARWTPYEDQRRNISDDLKHMFAEAKSDGLNPKALRAAFAEKYRLDNQTSEEADKRLHNTEDFELYLSALARVRESGPEIDRSTGEVLDDRRDPSDKIEAALRTSERRAKAAGKEKPADIKHEPASTAPQLSAADAESQPLGTAEGDAGQASLSATQSTDQRTEQVAGQIGNALGQDRDSGVTAQPVETISEVPATGAPAAVGTAHNPIPAAVPGSINGDGLYSYDWLRRHDRCLDPDGCKPMPGKLCVKCSRAMPVAAGGVHIPHEGPVT